MDIGTLLAALSAEEKATLVAGTDFMYTNPVPRLGIPSLRMSDGPHGLRVQGEGGDNGVTGSFPATAFPTAAALACGWDEENARKVGRAIGKEAHKYGVHVVLGPGANIKRSPTAGRNFEYFSEDPLLAGKLAAAEAEGIQGEGVAACVKHFALNNAENFRFMGDSVSDMRAMREIYLKVFEIVVKESRPAAMMCAYNKINGEYCSQNKWLLTDVLRKEWGFDGLVMTDWGAMHDRLASLRAGLDLEMPGDTAVCRRQILDGIKDGSLSMEDLDQAAANVLHLAEKYAKAHEDDCDFAANDALARAVAADCAVLLKNDGILPLSEGEELFVCGDLFEKMRYQGAGSSMINPIKLTTPKQAFDDMGVKYTFARGYAESETQAEQPYIGEALAAAAGYQKALVFAGLTDYVESEGADRESMRLPANQLALIEALCRAGKQVAVVLFGGSPVELPFAEEVNALLNMVLPGQSGGAACADLLFGRAEPAGRLAETWPLTYADVPCAESFAKTANEVYKEGVFVGYRYYTTAEKEVRYPFGYGLSYTEFEYSHPSVTSDGEKITVRCTVKNAGNRPGAAVVQVYAGLPGSAIFRPRRELKAFKKLRLAAGQSAAAELSFPLSDLAVWNVKEGRFAVEGGEYAVEICTDCCTPVFSQKIAAGGEAFAGVYAEEVNAAYRSCRIAAVTDELFEAMSGQAIPPLPPKKPITMDSRFSDLAEAGLMGKILHGAVLSVANGQMKRAKKLPAGPERDNKVKGAMFMRRILESNSLTSMTMCAGSSCPYNFAQGFMHLANGHLWKGIKCFCTNIQVPKLPKEKEDNK